MFALFAVAAAFVAPQPCDFKGFRVVQANRRAVLLHDGAAFAGCYRRAPKLQVFSEFEYKAPPRLGVLSGRFAAAEAQSCNRYHPEDPCQGLVEVRDLKRRKQVTLFSGAEIYDIALKANGSVAFIASVRAGGPPGVWAIDKKGERKLDEAVGIDPRSLSLSGGTAGWLRAGAPVTARIH